MKEDISLDILGIADKIPTLKYKSGFGIDAFDENDLILFCDFSKFDIPIGYIFREMRDFHGKVIFSGLIALKKVSQEFNMPYDSIPKGHKTICVFKVLQGNSDDLIDFLPSIKNWYDSDKSFIFR